MNKHNYQRRITATFGLAIRLIYNQMHILTLRNRFTKVEIPTYPQVLIEKQREVCTLRFRNLKNTEKRFSCKK